MPKASKAAAANEDLPPDWEAREHEGKIVYINHSTKKTQWQKPKVKKSKGKTTPPSRSAITTPTSTTKKSVAKDSWPRKPVGPGVSPPVTVATPKFRNGSPLTSKPAVAASREPLPSGWESKVINDNVVYIDHANRITTYERPVAPAVMKSAPTSSTDRPSSSERGIESSDRDRLGSSSSGLRRTTNGGDDRNGNPYQSNRSNAGPKRVTPAPDSPLPPGWTRSATPQGELYYVNHVLETTTWSKPSWNDSDDEEEPVYEDERADPEGSTKSSKIKKGYSNEPPLPQGWEERMLAEGRVFYINHNDKTTHWERPKPVDAPAGYRPHTAVDKEELTEATLVDGPRPAPYYAWTDSDNKEKPSATTNNIHSSRRGKNSADSAVASARSASIVENQTGKAGEHAGTMAPEISPGKDGNALAKAEASVSVALMSGRGSDRVPLATVTDASRLAEEAASGAAAEPTKDVERSAPSFDVSPSPIPAREAETSAAVPSDVISASSIAQSGLFGPTIKRPVSSGANKADAAVSSNVHGKAGGNVSPTKAANVGDGASASKAAAGGNTGVMAITSKKSDEGTKLPEGWIALKTLEGKVYYQNSILKTTQWDRPRIARRDPDAIEVIPAQQKTAAYNSSLSGGGSARQTTAIGWEKVVSTDGKPYFQNTITRETSWNPPAGWVESLSSVATTSVGTHEFKIDEIDAGVRKATENATYEAESSGGKGTGAAILSREDAGASTFPTDISRQHSSAQGEAGPQEPPLPPGWEKLYTADHVPFWTNHNDRTTSWDPPSILGGANLSAKRIDASRSYEEQKLVASTGSPSEPTSRPLSGSIVQNLDANGRKLPEGWEMHTNDQGSVYYVDHINKRTSWDPPMMSSGGHSVIETGRPDIPPAELVPDSADLYMGADLLNQFFVSWSRDAQGKSPLEVARNEVVGHLTGTGLKVLKNRGGTSVQRYLYLSPNNKQVVWATRASTQGKFSKKGLALQNIAELQCDDGGIRIEMRGEETITLKSEALDSLTSEGASILLGVLLADMTGTLLRLEGVNGGSSCSYFPASFVGEVLKVRQAREKKRAAAAALTALESSTTSKDVSKHIYSSHKAGAESRVESYNAPSSKGPGGEGYFSPNGGSSGAVTNSLDAVRRGGSSGENDPFCYSSKMELSRDESDALRAAPKARVSNRSEEPELEKRHEVVVGEEGTSLQTAADVGEETEGYRQVLQDLLRPVKLERYIDNFLASGITLDILPLVERSDLDSVVGIESAVSQLKIMKQIKTYFPNGVL